MSASASAKWLVIVAIALLDAAWAAAGGFRVAPGGLLPVAAAVAALLAITVFYERSGRSERLAGFAHHAAQFLAFFAAAGTFSYLVVSTNAPLMDAALAEADRAIGFDWPAWFAWMRAHPALRIALALAYASLIPQVVLCLMWLTLSGRLDRSSELLWTMIVSLTVTIPISGLWPAASAWAYYQVGDLVNMMHMPHFTALRDGSLRVIDLTKMEGLITFPSFHTTLAMLLTYAARHRFAALAGFGLVNGALIVSVPAEGGHYVVDAFAGAAIAMVAIWAARRLEAALAERPAMAVAAS